MRRWRLLLAALLLVSLLSAPLLSAAAELQDGRTAPGSGQAGGRGTRGAHPTKTDRQTDRQENLWTSWLGSAARRLLQGGGGAAPEIQALGVVNTLSFVPMQAFCDNVADKFNAVLLKNSPSVVFVCGNFTQNSTRVVAVTRNSTAVDALFEAFGSQPRMAVLEGILGLTCGDNLELRSASDSSSYVPMTEAQNVTCQPPPPSPAPPPPPSPPLPPSPSPPQP
eukprot:356600-Chlamydomonas_euryale.AAC.3